MTTANPDAESAKISARLRKGVQDDLAKSKSNAEPEYVTVVTDAPAAVVTGVTVAEPQPLTVWQAILAAKADIGAVGKTGRNTQQNYDFRGIDAVVNAAGPAFIKHGITTAPKVKSATYRDVQTSTGKPAREVTVIVRYRFYGPTGDYLDATAPGESMDNGDKGTAKAMSVAYRIALLQVLTIPTTERDPDADSYERSNGGQHDQGQQRRQQRDRAAETPPPADTGHTVAAEVREAQQAIIDYLTPLGQDKGQMAAEYSIWAAELTGGDQKIGTASKARLDEYLAALKAAAASVDEPATPSADETAAHDAALAADGIERAKARNEKLQK